MSVNVRELIELLRQHPADAVVLVGDPNDGGVGTLKFSDVRAVRLRFGEANGLGWYELAAEGEPSDVPGVWLA